MSFHSKMFTILAIVVVTLGYGLYERNKYTHLQTARDLILQTLPQFTARALETNELITDNTLIQQGDRAAMVHLWGTWCGVCMDGLPKLIEFADRMEPLGVRFLLLAVNDEERELMRAMQRYDLPENVTVAMEESENVLDRFGSVRVPETYLFAANRDHLNKFIGPQEWTRPTYFDRVNRLIENSIRGRGEEVEAHQ